MITTNPKQLHHYLKSGCVHARLGRAKVPDGYAILINPDGYSFWIGPDDTESVIDWDQWRTLRRAKNHATTLPDPPTKS